MKLVIEDLKTDRQWRSATGFDKKKFEKLVIVYEQAYRELYGCPMAERETINPLGATLGNEEELLFFTLFSLKSGLTYDLLGLVTGMDASNAQKRPWKMAAMRPSGSSAVKENFIAISSNAVR
jgi:hypothetical protein